ncbi:MAG TPA: DUF2254 domain-containing protein [Gemmatimonadales bacterium]
MPSALGSRLALTWAAVRDSLWFVPSVSAVAGLVLAILVVRIPTPAAEGLFADARLFGGGAEGARGMLSAIASGLITTTGVVFSITIVAIQQASSQFTPRVLGSFMADRVNQAVLGVFIGTFTYTLLVLRTIRSPTGDREQFVPHVAVALALLLLLASIAALIVFIDHAARTLQVSVILHRETERTLHRIDELFPESAGDPVEEDTVVTREPAGPPVVIAARKAGYLETLSTEQLWSAAGDRRLTIRMEIHVGAFVFPGKALASVWPATLVDERVADGVREAFVLGPERTMEQDVGFGIVVISDIAVRALSPGINDPTTASHCVDRLTELLAALCRRRRPRFVRAGPEGAATLVTRTTTLERALGLAFDRIRHYGASDPSISKKLLEALMDLATVCPRHDRRAIVAQVDAVARAAQRGVPDAMELAEVERLAAEARAAAMNEGPPDPRPTSVAGEEARPEGTAG